jgi:hypothetical protein
MLTIEAEIKYESEKNEVEMKKKLASLESQLCFMTDQMKHAEKSKSRALKEVEELKQKQFLEQKRLNAEKRLLETKKRRHESVMIAASQAMMSSQPSINLSQPGRPPRPVTPPPLPASYQKNSNSSNTSVQMDILQDDEQESNQIVRENQKLLTALMSSISRDLLKLLMCGKSSPEDAETQQKIGELLTHSLVSSSSPNQQQQQQQITTDSTNSHSPKDTTVGLSQSVFSQIASQAQVQVEASKLHVAMEVNFSQALFATERAQDLYDAIGRMLRGENTSLCLVSEFIKYLIAPTDLESDVLTSVISVLFFVIKNNPRFQHYLTAPVVTVHSDSTSGASSSNSCSTPSADMRSFPRNTRISGLEKDMQVHSLQEFQSRQKNTSSWSSSTITTLSKESSHERSKLLSALCRVIRNHATSSEQLVEKGLDVLSLWVELLSNNQKITDSGIKMEEDLKQLLNGNVLQEILLSPKLNRLVLAKCKALNLFIQLIHVPVLFPLIETSVNKNLLLNRCARMLSVFDIPNSNLIKQLQSQVIRLFFCLITTFPSIGIRFVLEKTRAPQGKDLDYHHHEQSSSSSSSSSSTGIATTTTTTKTATKTATTTTTSSSSSILPERSIIYHLVMLLDQETFDARTNGLQSIQEQELLNDSLRMQLIKEAFVLLSVLIRYVDNIKAELDGPEQEQILVSILVFIEKINEKKDFLLKKTTNALFHWMSSTIIHPPNNRQDRN